MTPFAQAAMRDAVAYLREWGTEAGMPHVRAMSAGLWELRARDRDGIYRILYFHWRGRTFGFLHGFTKTTRTTPKADLELARQRLAIWLSRGE